MSDGFERATEQPRALVVEYDRWLRTMVASMLEDLGFDVATASNGYTGLRHALALRPDVLVVGRGLPELSRDALARELAQQTPGASVPHFVDSDALIGAPPAHTCSGDGEDSCLRVSTRNVPVHATQRYPQHDRQRQHRDRALSRIH